MARKNKFMDQETDFLGMLDEDSTEDNLTKTIVRELDQKQETTNEILCAPVDSFIPYNDEKLRLDLHQGEDRERLKESIKLNGIFTSENIDNIIDIAIQQKNVQAISFLTDYKMKHFGINKKSFDL